MLCYGNMTPLINHAHILYYLMDADRSTLLELRYFSSPDRQGMGVDVTVIPALSFANGSLC